MRFASIAIGVSTVGLFCLAAACTVKSTQVYDPDGGTTPITPKGDSGSSGGPSGSACDTICTKAASANCSQQATCAADCQADLAKIPAACKDEADAVQTCAATKATSFKCDSKGKAVVAAGCDTEGNALVQCVLNPPKQDGGPPTGCGTLQTGNAACDTCQAANCCAEGAACSSDTNCTDIIDCFNTNSCADDPCFTSCENAHTAGKAKELAFFTCLQNKCAAQCQ